MFVLLIIFVVAFSFSLLISSKVIKKFIKKPATEVQQSTLSDSEIKKMSEYFVNKEEKYLSSLGNGYILNFIANRTLNRGFAVISDKRVYFRGSCFSGQGKKYKKTEEERTIDIKDITGSGFIYQRYIGIILSLFATLAVFLSVIAFSINYLSTRYTRILDIDLDRYSRMMNFDNNHGSFLRSTWRYFEHVIYLILGDILAGIFIPLAVLCFLAILDYFRKRKTLFEIQYAGGNIAFDVSFYAKAEIEDFQKQLRRAKDLSEETTTVKPVAVEPVMQASSHNSAADDLRKYAELLKDGMISQEEYDAMKKKILDL